MKREIKFRVWNKKENLFLLPKFIDDIVFAATDEIIECANQDDFVFQQFIGLKDKNKKEIYEGDIVRTDYFGGDFVGVMEYKLGRFVPVGRRINIKNSVIEDFDCYNEYSFLEIIGNIFENPELLK